MPRYFLEVCYNGAQYSGFQSQENAVTIQQEVEKALAICFRKLLAEAGQDGLKLTGSSRTDAGVHAKQNYFHFDAPFQITTTHLYNLNALLPHDIALNAIHPVNPEAHCRFDAIAREYRYYVYRQKNPFLVGRAYYYPYKTDIDRLNELAALFLGQHDFSAFSKRNTQVKTFDCTILLSRWTVEGDCLVYYVAGNRFLRGMVRGLVGTMLNLAKLPDAAAKLVDVIASKDCTRADFSVPGHGLFLMNVQYKEGLIPPSRDGG